LISFDFDGMIALRENRSFPSCLCHNSLDARAAPEVQNDQILSSYPEDRVASMIRVRMAPTSSDDNVRSGAPTVSR
jgi:hypothetical protein